MTATPANETGIEVLDCRQIDGFWWIEVPTPNDWDDAKNLPKLLNFDGRRYGWSCYNSDRHVAIYSDRWAGRYAAPVKGSGKVGHR